MSTLHEAAQLALEALEYGQHSLKQISEYQWESRGQLAMDALKAALAQPEPAQELDVYSYAALLATTIHAKYYKDTAPQWKPLPDLLGVLTQIDNMTAGLTRQPEPAQEPVGIVRVDAGEVHIVPTARDADVSPLKDGQAVYATPQPQPEPAQEPVACMRTWHKDGEQHAELRAWEDGIDGLPDGEHLLYTAPPKPEPAQEPITRIFGTLPVHDTQQPEPAQEPVAVALHTGTKQGIKWHQEVEHGTPLYTAPQSQRPPLTDGEIAHEVYLKWGMLPRANSVITEFARAIERKVRGE